MLRTRGHVFVRAISAVCVTALVLAACGGSDSSSNRNGRLNSTLCFDTQIDKEQAIEDAQRALDEAKTPSLEEASPSNNGGRATLAFIGPQLWWMRAASGGTTTTTTQPATTTSTSTSTSSTSTTVASSISTTSSTSTTVASSTESTDVSTDSTDVSTDSTDIPTETSVPLVGDMVLQQLQDALNAATNAPLCSELDAQEASDTTLNESETVECSAMEANGSLSFSCEQPLYTVLSYFTSDDLASNAGNRSTFGDGSTVYDLSNDVYEPRVFIYHGLSYEFLLVTDVAADGNATYDFMVPIVEESPETEFVDEDEGYEDEDFSGTINPRIGVNELSFTVPEDYSASDLLLGLTFECESQELEASWYRQGVYVADFVNPSFDLGLPEGICFFGLYPDDPEYVVAGETYDVVITAATDVQIEWEGPVELEGDGVSLDEGSPEEPYYSGFFDPTTGEDTVTFTIPNNYSAPYFILELYAECEDQSIEAELIYEGGSENFQDPSAYFPTAFGAGLCGVWLFGLEVDAKYLGETFEVVIRTETNQRISWSGTVALEGDGVTQAEELIDVNDEQFIWEELFSGEIDAEHYMTLEIPEGGRQVDVRAITTRFENDEPYVNPYLVIFNDNYKARDWDNNGGEAYGYGEYSSRLNVFLEEGTYTLLATTYDLWSYEDDQWPTTYDLELRVGSLPVSTDKVAPSVDQPEEQQVQVEVLDAPPSNLEEPKPVFELPVNEVINRDKSSNEPNPIIPAGVTEVVCDSGCLLALREAAGVSEGIVTVQIGGELIEVQPGARNAIIPVRPSAKEILVTVTPNDGGEPVVLSTEVLVISPRTFPTKMAEGAKTVTKSASSNGGIPTNLIVVLTVLALAIAIGLIRRQKVRLPE